MFKFRRYDPEGEDLGDYVTAVPGPWLPGDNIYDGGSAKWRICSVITADDFDSDVYRGIWEVEPIAAQ